MHAGCAQFVDSLRALGDAALKLSDCQQVADAGDLRTFESRLLAGANELGFGIISGCWVTELPGAGTNIQYIGNTPAAFQATFTSAAVGRRDPVLQRLKRLTAPVIYDQATYVTGKAGDLWEVQAPYGYKTGISMSLHLPEGQHFVIGVDREQPLPRDEIVLTQMIAAFELFAMHAHLAAQRLMARRAIAVRPLPLLSKRETEILKWTMEGKSAWAVARILSISENTVNFHVQKALTKLAVSSKHQAAAKARSLGLI